MAPLADMCAFDAVSIIKQNFSFFIPQPTWTTSDMPDLTGKIIIVTGGNSGLGKESAKALLTRGAKVYLGCRNKERAERAILDLERDTGKKAIYLHIDLASMKSVKEFATEFLSMEKELHVLMNNAGTLNPPPPQLAEGYDLTFHTNTTGAFYLTQLLLPTLLETAKHSPPKSVRVIALSSSGHYGARAQPLDFASLKGESARKGYSSLDFYYQSKFANVIMALELHRRYADQGLVSISLNPGTIKTELQRNWNKPLMEPLYSPIKLGILTQLYAATAEGAGNCGGKFLIPWARVGKARSETDDTELGKELWNWLEEQIKSLTEK